MASGVKICDTFSHLLFLTLGSISNKFGPCPMDCDLNLLKEDRELHKKVRWKP